MMNKNIQKRPRILAFYLPQFHPIPENDRWWGKGFTEWTNVAKAKKYFPGHYQPRIPADLGFYDLRVPETRNQQSELAKEAGIDGFCYWHYWFEPGKELLQRPFDEVVASGSPDFPFCLAWANEDWYAKSWSKNGSAKLLIEQKYCGTEDYTAHFYRLLPAFKDTRYIRQDGKPVFMVYKPLVNSEIKVFMNTWQELAKKEGFPGIYFIAHCFNDRTIINKCLDYGYDSVNTCCISDALAKRPFWKKAIIYIGRRILREPYICSYKKASKYFFDLNIDSGKQVCPSIITGWDHTPRSGARGCVFTKETPELFYDHAKYVLENANGLFIFVKSWNEWAEGNYLEPDLVFGKEYMNSLKRAISEYPPPTHINYTAKIRAIHRCYREAA